jgi:hypothetical protein
MLDDPGKESWGTQGILVPLPPNEVASPFCPHGALVDCERFRNAPNDTGTGLASDNVGNKKTTKPSGNRSRQRKRNRQISRSQQCSSVCILGALKILNYISPQIFLSKQNRVAAIYAGPSAL